MTSWQLNVRMRSRGEGMGRRKMNMKSVVDTTSFRDEIAELELMFGVRDEVSTNEPVDESQEWRDYMNNESPKTHGRSRMKRFMRKLVEGRGVKPCGKECYAWGNAIIASGNHKSMFYSKILTNDRYYLVQAARITPSPMECSNFFYYYINEHLKANAQFRLEFLKALFLNDNILTRPEIEWFVNQFGFEAEYELIKLDLDFKAHVQEVFDEFYHLSEQSMNSMAIKTKKGKKLAERNITRMNNEYIRRYNSLMSCFGKQKLYAGEQEDEFDEIVLDPTLLVTT